MKAAAIAVLCLLIVLPAQAGQRHRQSASPETTCDNDGHCTTPAVATAPVAGDRTSRKKTPTVTAATRAPVAAADPANNTQAKAPEVTTGLAAPSAADTTQATAEAGST